MRAPLNKAMVKESTVSYIGGRLSFFHTTMQANVGSNNLSIADDCPGA
jgi:hypothetical protein